MSELFGTEYFGFIASAYAITAVVILAMIMWVLMTQVNRRRALAELEKAGLKRASRDGN